MSDKSWIILVEKAHFYKMFKGSKVIITAAMTIN